MIFKNLDGTTKRALSLGDPTAPARVVGAIEWDLYTTLGSTTSTTYVTHREFITPSLPAGIYEIRLEARATLDKANKWGYVEFVVGGVQVLELNFYPPVPDINDNKSASTFYTLAADGTIHIDINFKTGGGNPTPTITISRTLISVRRVK